MTSGEPTSWLVVEKGWRVVAADGTDVGKVTDVIGDTTKDIFNGLAIATGLLSGRSYVPAERVAEITEGTVRLDVGPDTIESLDDYDEPPPSSAIRPA